MMLLPPTPELRSHYIPDLIVDISSYSNLRVVAPSLFPTSELLSFSYIRPQSCMFHIPNPIVDIGLSFFRLIVVPSFATSKLFPLLQPQSCFLLFQPQSCCPPQPQNWRSVFSNPRVDTILFPTSKLLIIIIPTPRADVDYNLFPTAELRMSNFTPFAILRSKYFNPQQSVPNLRVDDQLFTF